jgi:predicted dehydrogenase
MKRIGIVGVGGFASTILRSVMLVESEGLATLEGAAIRNPPKRQAIYDMLKDQGRPIFASMDEMIESIGEKLDIISIPAGIPSHSRLAIKAMEAGFDVVLEKPVAATIQEVDAIIETSERTGHFCAIGYHHTHTPAIMMLRDEIARGRFGKIKSAKCYALWPRGSSYYGRNVWAGKLWAEDNWVLDGPITNANAHFLNNMLNLVDVEMGGEATIESLQGELYHAKDIPTYDTGCLRATMNSGAVIHFYLSHAVNRLQNPITIVEGENGTATWYFDGAKLVLEYDHDVVYTAEGMGNDAHAEVFRDAIAVAEGRRERPIFTVKDGRNHVLAVNLLFESSGGIRRIPAGETYREDLGGGESQICVKGMEETVEAAFEVPELLAEQAPPWATPGVEVKGAGYTEFPQSPDLREFLSNEGIAL